jgi:hypothetical protein
MLALLLEARGFEPFLSRNRNADIIRRGLKRVKRVAFGFTNFENFRIRALPYAGKPNLRTFDSIVVR